MLVNSNLEDSKIRSVITPFVSLKGGLMEALHAVQHAYGHISAESYGLLAQMFNLSRAEVYGVKSFYHDFRDTPAGHHVIKICQAESCQARGSRLLTAHVEKLLGIRLGETTANERITLEPVYCLGNCAVSPNITINDKLYGRMDEDRLEGLLGKLG